MKKPNIILITTDQQRKDSLGCYGSDFVSTPNLDTIAANGIRFNRAYCTNPVCTPSRASIYSGCYISRHGSWNVGTQISEELPMLSHILKGQGYRTHHIGKAHFQPYTAGSEESLESVRGWERLYPDFTGPYYGFDTIEIAMGHSTNGISGHYGDHVKRSAGSTQFATNRRTSVGFGGAAHDWDIPIELHNSCWTADRSIAFLQEATRQDEPFFLSIGFQDPHHPHAVPTERARTIDASRIPLPVYLPGELDDKPGHFRDVHEGLWSDGHPLHGQFPLAGQGKGEKGYRHVTDEDARLGRAYYYALVEMIDEAMGRMMAALQQLGLEENTIIVFTSDHGELLGDHGIWMKGPFHYEPLISVPLLLQWKGQLPEGVSTDAIISLADLAPTLLSLSGLPAPSRMDGIDSSSWLRNGAAIKDAPRQQALVEFVDDPNKIRLKTIVQERYKLTAYYGDYGKTTGELYDLLADPGEIRNLWNDSAFQTVKSDLLQSILWELETIENRRERISYA